MGYFHFTAYLSPPVAVSWCFFQKALVIYSEKTTPSGRYLGKILEQKTSATHRMVRIFFELRGIGLRICGLQIRECSRCNFAVPAGRLSFILKFVLVNSPEFLGGCILVWDQWFDEYKQVSPPWTICDKEVSQKFLQALHFQSLAGKYNCQTPHLEHILFIDMVGSAVF